jgi:hypothetical protein
VSVTRACANWKSGDAQTIVGREPVGGSTPPARINIEKLWGPYESGTSPGRLFVIRREVGGKNRTISHAKHVWEMANGRVADGYQVHHKDHDHTNDALDNLELVENYQHRFHHMYRGGEEMYHGTCPVCQSSFTQKARHVRANRKKGKGGPYCSKRCSGIASHR